MPEDYEHRLRMVELACANERALEASSLERGTEKSYSIYTIEKVRGELRPCDRLLFIIGSDAFADLTAWHRWQEVAALVDFVVVTRPGHPYTVPDGVTIHPLEDRSSRCRVCARRW